MHTRPTSVNPAEQRVPRLRRLAGLDDAHRGAVAWTARAREAGSVVEPQCMTGDDPTPPRGAPSLIERRALRIADARSVVIGLALTFVGLAFVAAIVIRIVDPDNFPSLGLAIWWALQTVTTVGYGDVVPTTAVGRVIGGIETGRWHLVHHIPHGRGDEHRDPAWQRKGAGGRAGTR